MQVRYNSEVTAFPSKPPRQLLHPPVLHPPLSSHTETEQSNPKEHHTPALPSSFSTLNFSTRQKEPTLHTAVKAEGAPSSYQIAYRQPFSCPGTFITTPHTWAIANGKHLELSSTCAQLPVPRKAGGWGILLWMWVCCACNQPCREPGLPLSHLLASARSSLLRLPGAYREVMFADSQSAPC